MSMISQSLTSASSRRAEAFRNRWPTPSTYPATVFLEPTNVCNLRCPLCPTGAQRMTRPPGMLSLTLAERVMDEIAGQVELLAMNFYGEPFVHPDITMLLGMAQRRRIPVKLYSNLTLTPRAGWQAVLEAGLDILEVSFDGLTQITYESYRRNGRLSDLLANLSAIVELRQRLGLQKPWIEAQMLALRANEGEWQEYVRRCRELGVDSVKRKYVNLGPSATSDDAERYLPRNPALSYYQLADEQEPHPRYTAEEEGGACRELYDGPAIITWDGRFALCCRDHDATNALGSAWEQTIWQFWNGPRMAELRRRVNDAARRPEL